MFEKKVKDKEYSGGNFTVRIRQEESVETLIKRHLKKLKKEKLLEEVFDRKYYKKPTTKKREAKFKRDLILKKLREAENAGFEMEE